MTFSDCLKNYMNRIPCTAAELSAVSGLASSMISRYLRVEQTPGDKALRKLASALDFLSRDKGGSSLDNIAVYQEFQMALSGMTIEYPVFLNNLSSLMNSLGISNRELAGALNFDPSYISRILSGSRRPSDLTGFLDNVSGYIAERFCGTPSMRIIADLADHREDDLDSKSKTVTVIKQYLGSSSDTPFDLMTEFLREIAAFDPEEYRKTIPGDLTASGRTAGIRTARKEFHGISGMESAWRGFFRIAANEKSREDMIIYNDIPSSGSAEFRALKERNTARLVLAGSYGKKSKVIQASRESFREQILEIRDLLPALITGSASVYCLKEAMNGPFLHTVCSSASAGISAESFIGSEGDIRCTLYGTQNDSEYTRRRAGAILDLSEPIMIPAGPEDDTLSDRIKDLCAKEDILHLFPCGSRNEVEMRNFCSSLGNKAILHTSGEPFVPGIGLILCPSRFVLVFTQKDPRASLLITNERMTAPLEQLLER